MRQMRKPKLIYYNDSRHEHFFRFDPPMSLHRLRQPAEELIGSGVDMLSYGLGMGLTFLYDTKVSTRFGELTTKHDQGTVHWRAAQNFEQALKAGYDPLKVVVDRAHEKGIQIVGSLRINDAGAPDEGQYNKSRIKLEHPELMIGEEDPDSAYAATCLDFGRPEVREERLGVIEEACDRYGMDGIEIDDYVRVFFKRSEVGKNTPILTGFVREVREMLDQIGKKRGERLCLAVRADLSEEANLSVGMDVRAWLSGGLVDIVVPDVSRALTDTNLDLGWLATAAHEGGAWVYARIGAFPYDDRYHGTTIEMYRAASMNYREAGADGIYMEDLPQPRTEREYNILREMADPDTHARGAKHYFVGATGPGKGRFHPKRYLPVTLEEGQPARVPISVADDVESARRDGDLRRVALAVRIVSTCPEDKLSFRFNGQELKQDPVNISSFYGGTVSLGAQKLHSAYHGDVPMRINTHYWFEFDLEPALVRLGENEVEVTMDRRFQPFTYDRVLHNVEVRVAYQELPTPIIGQM